MQCNNMSCPRWEGDAPTAKAMDESFVWPPPLAPRKTFRERAWRLVGPSNRVLVCEIVRVATGLEVQVRYDCDPDAVRTQLTGNLADARTLAAHWRDAALGLGSFLELDADV